MLFQKENLQEISTQIDQILNKVRDYESRYSQQILNVHPNYQKSAKNLIHYLALRTFDNDILQNKLYEIGLPSSTSSESSVLQNIITFKTIINSLLKNDTNIDTNISLN